MKGKSIDQHIIVTKEEKGKIGRGEMGRRLRVVALDSVRIAVPFSHDLTPDSDVH